MSNEINLVEYEKEIGLFFKGKKNPNEKETNKKGDAYFQILSKATKEKLKNMISFYLKIKCYINNSKRHFFLCEYFNKHIFETFGFATLCD